MLPRLCFIDLDCAFGLHLREQVAQACVALQLPLTLLDDERGATHAVIDMDTPSGPMSWLRLHGRGTLVVGLTSAARTNAEYHLARTADSTALQALLCRIAADAGAVAVDPRHPDATRHPDAAAPAEHAGARIMPLRPAAAEAQTHTLHWLQPGTAGGRYRFQRGSAPALLIDTHAGIYHGPARLRPLAGILSGPVDPSELQPIAGDDWPTAIASAGAAQPLSRLHWYHALLSTPGLLPAGCDARTRFRMLRWHPSEREFPKHFRIATVMLRGAATQSEIADAANVDGAEAADFIRASLACGHAEVVDPAPPAAATPQRAHGGLLARFRGR